MMLRSTLAGLRGQLRRLVATTLAVVFGVAFVAGTLIFGDTARAGYVEAFAGIATNVDVVVQPAGDGKAPLTGVQLAAVRALPDVAAAEGRMAAPLALLDKRKRPVTNFGQIGLAVSVDGDAGLRPYEIAGRNPGAGEALLDTDTAERLGYATGDTITVVDSVGERRPLVVVGLIDFGVSRQYAGQSVVGLPSGAVVSFTGRGDFREIAIRARDGVDPAALTAAVAAAVGAGQRAITGGQWRADLVEDAAGWVTPFRIFLLLFGLVSLIVAAFVIYNTFAVLGALRVRQTALLRCVGATRRQIFGATVLESAIVGLVGGALGTLLGVGVSYALVGLFNSTVDAGIPVRSPVLGALPIVAGLVLGSVVTVAAALLPALRATRTLPVAALRDQPTASPGARRVAVRTGSAVLVAGLGVAVTVLGYRNSDQQTGTILIVFGGVLTFLGLLIASPLFIGPLCTVLGAVAARPFGTPGRLARADSRRNPGRTAITSATLMVGIGLMSVFTVVMSSVDVTTAGVLARQYPVDFVATGVRYGTEAATVPAGYADALRGRPEFDAVGQLRTAAATVNGVPVRIGAIDAASLGTLITPDLTAGTLADLTAGTAILAARPATLGNTPLGGTLTIAGERSTASVRVVAVAPALAPAVGNLDLLVVWPDLVAIAGEVDDTAVFATTAPGVSPNAAAAALDALADRYPLVSVGGVAILRSDLESTVDSLLALVAGLLVITIVISLFGVANTLSLSVVERTRESATIRALGLTRGQLRVTLLLEALLMAAAGALIGLGFGLAYGAVLVNKVLSALDPILVVPWAWFGGIIALVTLTAVLAALLPARRAVRSAIVAAMADT
ncbi:MAG TPA: FtsX-like permease family protein [Candidatus Limnocylindrales bacterium]|nr:FtsX-like permease family protein [Candidatus Limnocylindrales bacterium]